MLTVSFSSYSSGFPLKIGHHRRGFLIVSCGNSSGVKQISFVSPLNRFRSLLNVMFSPMISPLTVHFMPRCVGFVTSTLTVSFARS